MFERFTERARQVVVVAQEEARLLDHGYIGTEHLLLGLVGVGDGVATRVLDGLEIGLDSVRLDVEDIIGRGDRAPSGHIPFTPRAKKVLELSLREALQLGHNYIGTEHILLAVIREGEGVAAEVLVRRGAHLSEVRQRVLRELSDGPAEPMSSDDPMIISRLTPLGRTSASAPFTVGPPAIADRVTPGLLAVVFVLVAAVAVAVDRPPTTLGRVGLAVLLAGLVAALVVAVTQPAFLPPPLARHPGRARRGPPRLSTTAFAVAVLAFGLAAGLLVVDALLG